MIETKLDFASISRCSDESLSKQDAGSTQTDQCYCWDIGQNAELDKAEKC